MRKKTFNRLLILGTILFLLIFFIFCYQKIKKITDEKKSASPFKTLKKQDIKKMIFEKENKKYEVYKKNNSWYLKENNIEIKADKEKIEKIIEAVTEIKKEEIISKNKNKHQDFGIGKNKIIIFTQKKQISIYVGNNAGFNNNYLRVNEENEVFLGKDFEEFLNTNDWRELKVNLIEKEDNVEEVTLNYEGKTLVLKKEENEWKVNQKKAKKDRVDFFINEIFTLKGNDIVPYKSPSDINPSLTIQIREKNQIKKANFFKKDENNYWLTISFNNFVYQISSAYVLSLKKNEEDFIQ